MISLKIFGTFINRKIETKLGLAFFADRDHNFGVPIENLYGVGLNMKSVQEITRSEIDAAWEKIGLMGGGGDGPEGAIKC